MARFPSRAIVGTLRERMRLVAVLVEEPVGFLQVGKVLGDQTAEGGAKESVRCPGFHKSAGEKIDVVDVRVHRLQTIDLLPADGPGPHIAQLLVIPDRFLTAERTVVVVGGQAVVAAALQVQRHDVHTEIDSFWPV